MYQSRAEYRAAWDRAYAECPPVPLNVDIELASACNAKCGFCLYGDRDWTGRMLESDWDGKKKKRLMPKEMAFRIIDECAEIGVPALKFNFRGESLIHPDYGDIITHAYRMSNCGSHKATENAAEFCDEPFWELLANTNGNIPAYNWESGIRGLMACTKVMVSLDSLVPETYEKVRVGLRLGDAIRTIDELVKRGHQDLWVRRVVCRDNRGEDFAEMARARWPKGVRVSEHHVFDRAHYSHQGEAEDRSGWERQFCGYPAQRCVIEASGRYSACCIAWEGELSGGKWPETSIMDYWNGAWRKELTGQLRANDLRNAKCKNCTSFMAFKRPERAFVQDIEVAK